MKSNKRQLFRLIFQLLSAVLFSLQSAVAQNSYSQLRGSPEDSLLTKNFPGAWNLPGTDLYMKIGGYFRLDALYDFTGAGSRNQLLMGQIPIDGTEAANAGPFFNMHVRETRFNFDVRRTTGLGRPLKFFLEFDFFDESLSAGIPRLRHAFVKYGNVLVGQTWTNLSDLRIFPYIMDFSAGDALFGGRSIQVRYEKHFSTYWLYSLALEMPGLNGIYAPDNEYGAKMPVMPLFSARINNERDNGMFILGAQMEHLRWDGRNHGPDASTLGWGVVFNGRQAITKRLFATWHSSYNLGLVSQIIIFGGTDQGAVLLPDGDLHLENAITLALGGGYQLSKSVSANLAYAYADRGKLDYRPDDTMEKGGMGHFNFIWQIDPKATTGIEYAWGKVRTVDNSKGNASRIQVMVKYAF